MNTIISGFFLFFFLKYLQESRSISSILLIPVLNFDVLLCVLKIFNFFVLILTKFSNF